MYKEYRNWYIKETLQYVWILNIVSKFLENTLPNIEVIEKG